MKITQHQEDSKGYFKAELDGKEAGRMTYTMAGKSLMIIDHTEVYPGFSGKNAGKLMVMEAIDFARTHHIKVIPLCPFAKSVFDRNNDIRDVLNG